jgi:cytochrome c-type biogenesis protein CcsB
MFSVWFATFIALILELRNRRGLFGAAAAFVGTASMVALLTVPYFYRDIGGEISQVQGVLMSYWLYIHVTMVVAAYGLIGMMFLLSIWWLWGYYKEYGTLSRIQNQNRLSADGIRGQDMIVTPGGAVVAPTLARSLMELVFLARPAATVGAVQRVSEDETPQFQARLDACNLVVLHLIFWILGVGIILGAVWADMSWGRPWGWDPKETFALVTWIVYLIIVHVRVITHDKAWWTAVLGIIGFFIMLFNWIGVNFFLTGLHSYAG